VKQAELNQLNSRIEEIQQSLKKKKIILQPVTSTNSFKNALDSVQNTLNNINIAEIEKRMVQLANSFNLINTSQSSINSSNIQKQVHFKFSFVYQSVYSK
jgi:vacuolar-type H+-ATPase subunit I/STV1